MSSQAYTEHACSFWLSSLYHTLYPPHPKLGVATSLNFASIPEADRAIQVIKDWIRDLLYNLSPWTHDKRHFLSDAAELTALAYAFDRSGAKDYVPRAEFMVDPRRRLREHMRGKENERYILQDLLAALDGSHPSSVAAGVLFLRYVQHTFFEDLESEILKLFLEL